MASLDGKPYLPLAIVGGLLAALLSLAALQYRWIARLSELERDRLESGLASSATRFCGELDGELARIRQSFQPPEPVKDLDAALADRLARWRSTASRPRLVRELFIAVRIGGDEVELRRLDEATGRLEPAPWEPALESLRSFFAARGRLSNVDERLPGVVLPIRSWTGQPEEEGGRRPSQGPPADGNGDRRPPRAHLVVRLDLEVLRREVLLPLAEREFGEGRRTLAYSVTIRTVSQPAIEIFQAGPRIEAVPDTGDLVRSLFSIPRPGNAPEPGRWNLTARFPSGSLEDAVAGARRRNLGISLAILLLLGTTVVLMVISTRRAQRLARQQMDFVAGVSHELKTPLTTMRSAGQNLAAGIVEDPEKVRTYGALIEREGRRLTEMVGRVLTFAGIRSGAHPYQAETLSVASLVHGVLADFRWAIEERRFRVECHVDEGLPAVQGDGAALRQALANLVENAMKYGGPAKWIGLTAREEPTLQGKEVVVSISDRGIGIRRADLQRLFEPFFRSTDPSAAGITGSGLGLAVVRGIAEAHRGRVTVESAPGKGSTFALHLPVAPAPSSGEHTS